MQRSPRQHSSPATWVPTSGCAKVYGEKQSGAKTDVAEQVKLLRRLEPGDVLMVTRLDRLARSTRDLLNILHVLGERSIGFKSLADSWADTTTPHGRLLLPTSARKRSSALLRAGRRPILSEATMSDCRDRCCALSRVGA
jgi:DNA invertase Pin-like site-specific DNA recombinase